MGIEPDIIEVHPGNTELLSSFIKELQDEQDSFRYYKNRNLDTIKNHVFTMLLLDTNKPIGYGHLDQENDVVWLGIVVNNKYQGMGLSKTIMDVLLRKAEEKGLKSIRLSVDNDNEKAISLYKRFGFIILKAEKNRTIYQRTFLNNLQEKK